MDLMKVYEVVGGELNNFDNIIINKIKTNSKEVNKNDLFLAINKGHDYIKEAINNGASAIIVEKETNYKIPTIKVESTILALGKLASYIRSLYNIPLIAITGSTGKTTTKELVSLILSSKYKVLKSIENKNNHIGLPLTLLNLDDTYDFIVVELGMNHLNEIDYLSKICRPDCAIITNIGTAHIGNLGSKKNILKAKMEIINGMDNGLLVLNGYDKLLRKVKYKNSIKVNKRNLKIKKLKYFKEHIQFKIDNVLFKFNNSFKHIFIDLLLAIKIGMIFKVPLKDISNTILNYNSIGGRLSVTYNKYKIIDDSYNSSYESLIGGLKHIKKYKNFKIIILGDMLELGKYSIKYHKKINKYLKKIKNKEVLLIGEYTKYIGGIHFNNIDDINNYLKNNLKDNSIIYIKGSRSMNLDKIIIKK